MGDLELVAGIDDCDPEFDELGVMDGIALDTDGSFITLLTAEDGLHNPASVVPGVGAGNEESIFFTNYAVLPPVLGANDCSG